MNKEYSFNIKRKRPEDLFETVSDYFNEETLIDYAESKSIMRTQKKITIRALELLELKNNRSLILDAGCGPGFAAAYLNELGYKTVALDIISNFLKFYSIEYLNPILADMCYPPFKPESFDSIISISALQWVVRDVKNKNERLVLTNLFVSFYQILKPESRMIVQFYPKNTVIMDYVAEIVNNKTYFKGNFIIDNPNNPKKRKVFLLLKK
ncbi:MAG: class I SAM-dependent methyltransferase [Candidatus Lokiarchaeota archaeon]|nr:class I SAM-dependent methyltransferase [Candidatus Lokiarchaeota archaeon]